MIGCGGKNPPTLPPIPPTPTFTSTPPALLITHRIHGGLPPPIPCAVDGITVDFYSDGTVVRDSSFCDGSGTVIFNYDYGTLTSAELDALVQELIDNGFMNLTGDYNRDISECTLYMFDVGFTDITYDNGSAVNSVGIYNGCSGPIPPYPVELDNSLAAVWAAVNLAFP